MPFDISNDLLEDELKSARLLDKALEAEEENLRPSRTLSHFVELNSKNEDMLLEEIDDAEKSLSKMLLLDDDEPKKVDNTQDEEDENLLL